MVKMDVIVTSFFRSKECQQASNDAIVVYMVLRNDISEGTSTLAKIMKEQGFLVSGLDVSTLAVAVGLHTSTTQHVVEELIKRKWVKKNGSGIELGTIVDFSAKWYLDILLSTTSVDDLGLPDALRIAEKFRRKLEADKKSRSSISASLKEKILTTTGLSDKTTRSKDVLIKFQELYKLKFGHTAPMIEEGVTDNKYSVSYVYIGRAIKWSSSAEEVLQVLNFIFDKWDAIKDNFDISGPPTLNMIGSSKLYPRFVSCMKDGIPMKKIKYDRTGVVDRYKGSGTKDETW